ncbi:MAG: GNAT family N-acetyltransferase [Chloroflexi bacterium]|nr:GNAT family N-acetyltransferase [Chloroflexota bacterium]
MNADQPIRADTPQPGQLRFRPMDEVSARAILTWHYDPPYDIYDPAPEDVDAELRLLVNPDSAYYVIEDATGDLLAYCCFGAEGQVPGADYSTDALDIGLGVRPDLTGQGRGSSFVDAVILFARCTWAAAAFRVTIAQFNRRAQHVWERAGFRREQVFGRSADGMPFVVLTREA